MLTQSHADAFLSLPYPAWVYDVRTRAFLAVNDAAIAHYGYTREQFSNMTIADIRPSEDIPAMLAAVRNERETPGADGPWRHTTAAGETIFVETISTPVRFEDNDAVAVLVIDVTKRVQSELRLEYLAHHDTLTGLPNRLALAGRLEEIIRERSAAMIGVVVIHFSGLRAINETRGHIFGDEVLRRAAYRLREEPLLRDGIVGRWGDREFLALVPTQDDDTLQDLVTALRRTFERPFVLKSRTLHVSPTMGISVYPHDSNDAEELLRRAQSAMYAAVRLQTGCEMFTIEMETSVERHLLIENDLRAALERREFSLHVQPIFNATLERIIAVEALLRWKHPERGMLLPREFMDVADETGLIVPIGRFVIEEACRIASVWRSAGIDVPIAVNISGRQIYDNDLVADVSSALLQFALPPEYLEIELTESSVLKDMEQAIATIAELRDMGVRVAIDDFGTGYNSMVHLKRLPVHTLKIDRTFVNEMLENPFDFAVVEAMIGLARRLGLHVVAEGIETPSQAKAITQLGAEGMQGFLMSRPIAAEKFPAFYREEPWRERH